MTRAIDILLEFIASLAIVALVVGVPIALARREQTDSSQHPTLIYLETQVYDVAGLDEDQYVMRWYDPETKRVIQVDVRGKENAERVRKEIETR